MTVKDKYKQNVKLIDNMLHFIAHTVLTRRDRLRVVLEVSRIHHENERLKSLPKHTILSELNEVEITLESITIHGKTN